MDEDEWLTREQLRNAPKALSIWDQKVKLEHSKTTERAKEMLVQGAEAPKKERETIKEPKGNKATRNNMSGNPQQSTRLRVAKPKGL